MPECGSKTSTVPVVWANLECFRRDPNDFLSQLVTMDETWIYQYDPETKQQSMEWRHRDSPCPKEFRVLKSAGKVFASIFGIKRATSSFIIFQRTKLSTRSITHLCWCNLRTLWRKNSTGNSPRWCCSCTTMPRLTGHLQPRSNWPIWASNVLITHHILRTWPRRLPPIPWTEKTKERSPFFFRSGGHFCRGDLVGRKTFGFFCGLQNPEFGHCSLYPFW